MATEIPVKVTADTRQAERDIKRFEDSLDSLKDSAADVGKALAVITGAAAAMGFAILKTLDAAGALVDAADSLGVSAENLYKLHQASMLAGVGSDELNASLQRLSANIGEGLQKGTGPAVDALNRLNLPLAQIASQRPDQQFKLITDRLLEIENPALRAAAAIDLFGKQGPAILRVANEMEKVNQLKKEFGFGVTDRELIALKEAGESLDTLKILWESGIKKAVAEIAPYIIGFVEQLKEAIKAAGGFEGIWSKIRSILNVTLNIMLAIATVLAVRMVAGAAAFAIQLARAATSARAVSVLLSRTPIGLISAGIAAAATALGVDLVGAAGDLLDVTKANEIGQNKINEAVEEQRKKQKEVAAVTNQITEAQKKVLDEVNKTILGYERSARAQSDKLKFGETESIVQQRISEITEKLKEQNLQLTDAMRERVRAATEEEAVAKRIFDTRKTILDLEKQAQVARGANSELLGMQDTIKKATENRVLAERGSNQELLNEAIQQEAALKALYKDRVMVIAQGASERGKIEQDYYTKTNELEFLRQELIRTGVSTESQLFRDLNAEKLRLQEDYVRKSEELQLKSIEKSLMAQQGAAAQALSDGDRALLQKKGAEERQSAIVRERIEFEKKSEFEKAQWSIQQGASVFSALGAQNKRAFEAAKAFNIANAIMNTYAGATKALATYPWPFGLIAAAAAVAAGLAQVAQIRSQTYSGRALGGPVMGGTPYMVGESGPELFVTGNTGSIVRNGDLGGGTPVIVNFQITANDTTGFDQLLTSRKGVIQQIISDAMLEKGRRSMV